MRQPLLRFCSGTGLLTLSVAALALSLTASPSFALDDGDDTLLNELVGVISPEKTPDIDYKDRAPLVLPPKGKSSLPAPKLASEKPNAAWPNDPDVIRRRQAAAGACRAFRPRPSRFPYTFAKARAAISAGRGGRRLLAGSSPPAFAPADALQPQRETVNPGRRGDLG